MTDDASTSPQPDEHRPQWQPLGAIDRRVVGALAEKAKTTPAGYPMSLNSICTACNQKSNRFPVMQLEPDDVEQSLDRLRGIGAVGMIEGYGRVTKYRHYLYEWLGVDKVEMAVITELLLRGAQTVGELRGRAARMEPISDLAALQPIVESLKSKGLLISLTPEGRGHVVTHALYKPRELENLTAQYAHAAATAFPAAATAAAIEDESFEPAGPVRPPSRPPAAGESPAPALQREVADLRTQVAQLQSELEELSLRQQQTEEQLRELKDSLGA